MRVRVRDSFMFPPVPERARAEPEKRLFLHAVRGIQKHLAVRFGNISCDRAARCGGSREKCACVRVRACAQVHRRGFVRRLSLAWDPHSGSADLFCLRL